jgi:hypothetical protein
MGRSVCKVLEEKAVTTVNNPDHTALFNGTN